MIHQHTVIVAGGLKADPDWRTIVPQDTDQPLTAITLKGVLFPIWHGPEYISESIDEA